MASARTWRGGSAECGQVRKKEDGRFHPNYAVVRNMSVRLFDRTSKLSVYAAVADRAFACK